MGYAADATRTMTAIGIPADRGVADIGDAASTTRQEKRRRRITPGAAPHTRAARIRAAFGAARSITIDDLDLQTRMHAAHRADARPAHRTEFGR
jgi:hypothetical protein